MVVTYEARPALPQTDEYKVALSIWLQLDTVLYSKKPFVLARNSAQVQKRSGHAGFTRPRSGRLHPFRLG